MNASVIIRKLTLTVNVAAVTSNVMSPPGSVRDDEYHLRAM